jgi:perosamine synthetase
MQFFHTHVSPRAVALASEALKSGFISEGKLAREFERELAALLGLVNPVTVNSGTSALHLALVLAGVEPGDEVILPAQTFIASGLSILMCGAIPVFADIQPMTGNIAPESIARKITPKTKAVMPVHWAGYPCDMDEIQAIAEDAGLSVIEDAAHALGATYKDKPIGALSRFTAFSFQAIKHLTTGDGGALCCLDAKDEAEARRRRWFGIDRERDLPSPLGERQYNLSHLGFKYHLNDLAAAVGLGNLADAPGIIHRHREIAGLYRRELQGVPGLTHLELRSDRQSAHWVYTLLVDRRDDFVSALASRGVPASVVHQRIDRNALFGKGSPLEGQDFFDRRQIALPVHVGMTEDDVRFVIGAVQQGW